jgi:hypothetical protein
MSEEHVKFEGRLAVNRRERSEVQVRLLGLVRSLRDLLDPTRPVEQLDGIMISALAVDLGNLQIKYRELLKEAEIIRQYLPKGK